MQNYIVHYIHEIYKYSSLLCVRKLQFRFILQGFFQVLSKCSITTHSSPPRCDRGAPAAVRAPTLDPCNAARGGSQFHLSWRSSQWSKYVAFVAGEEHPSPFFLLSCSSPFLYIPLHSSLNLAASGPDPPRSPTRSSHLEEDSPKRTGDLQGLYFHTVQSAAGGHTQRLGWVFPDIGSGTSTIQHCDGTQRGNSVRYNDKEK